MAATVDTAAAKQAKQKKILIALSVVLVAVLAIQLPRMMGGSDAKPAAVPADGAATTEASATAPAPAAAPAAAASTTAAAVTGTGPSTSVAGVTVAGAGSVEAGTTRLASFSLFETKDPFVQQVVEESPNAGAPAAGDGDAAKGDAAEGAPASGSSDGGAAKPATPAMTNATVAVNGEIEQIEVKDVFPKDEPLFKLLALKPKSAKIGIAGGSLADGQFVTLGLGKKVTLVNSATGARYTIELQYVGTQPEQIEGFATGDAAATTPAATTAATP